MIELAKWDTDNFGLKIGNLKLYAVSDLSTLKKNISYAKHEGYDLLYLKGVDLPNDYLSDKIILADEKVIYTLSLSDKIRPDVQDSHVISILHHPLTDELLRLSYESGKYSRYHLDKRLPGYVFATLYRLWMKRSLNGEIATDVLAYIENGCIQGILTYHQTVDAVTIGIVAVNSQVSGLGIGSKLMQAFLSRLSVGTRVNVATQKRNEVACHYYEKNGFHVDSITNIYHIWL